MCEKIAGNRRQKMTMAPAQALTIACLLLEWELEHPTVTPPPFGWFYEVRQAAAALQQLKATLAEAK